MTEREKYIQHIDEMQMAYARTKSDKAKRDLKKGIHRAKKQLLMYDRYHNGE